MSRSAASVAMAADSTQDALPAATTRNKKKTSATATKKKKVTTKKVKKPPVRTDDSSDDCSERDSDLDLCRDLKPIGDYMRDRQEMMTQMLRSISNRKLQAMLPPILKVLSTDDLRQLCMEQLLLMSKKRVRRLLAGDEPDCISSTGSEESSSEDEAHEPADVVGAQTDNGPTSEPVSTDQTPPGQAQPGSETAVSKSDQPDTDTVPCKVEPCTDDNHSEMTGGANVDRESTATRDTDTGNTVINNSGTVEAHSSNNTSRVESYPTDSGSDSDTSRSQQVEELPPVKKLRRKKRIKEMSDGEMEEGEVMDSEYETDTDNQDDNAHPDTQQSLPAAENARTEPEDLSSTEETEADGSKMDLVGGMISRKDAENSECSLTEIAESEGDGQKMCSDMVAMLRKDPEDSECSLTDVGIELGVSEEMRLEIDNEGDIGSNQKSGDAEDIDSNQRSGDVASSSEDDVTVTINCQNFHEQEGVAKIRQPDSSNQRVVLPADKSCHKAEMVCGEVSRTSESSRTVIITSPTEKQPPPSNISGRRIVLKRKAQSSQGPTQAQPEVVSPKRKSLPESTPEPVTGDKSDISNTAPKKRQVLAPTSKKMTVAPIAKEALSQTHMEIVELELRARAIKAMLKAQEEFEKHSAPSKKAAVEEQSSCLKEKSQGEAVVDKKKEQGALSGGASRNKSADGQQRVIRLLPRYEQTVERKRPLAEQSRVSHSYRHQTSHHDLPKDHRPDQEHQRQDARHDSRHDSHHKSQHDKIAETRTVSVSKKTCQKNAQDVYPGRYDRHPKYCSSDPEELHHSKPNPSRTSIRNEPKPSSRRTAQVEVNRGEVRERREEHGGYLRRGLKDRRQEEHVQEYTDESDSGEESSRPVHHHSTPRRVPSAPIPYHRGRPLPLGLPPNRVRGLPHGNAPHRGLHKRRGFRGRPLHGYTPTFSREVRPPRRGQGRYIGHGQSGRPYAAHDRSRSRDEMR